MSQPPFYKPPVILCVDDEDDFRENLAEFLHHQSCEVIHARSGEEALLRLTEQAPDLVLCDMRMPHMSGRELFHHINAHYPELAARIPFLFLSATQATHEQLEAFSAGCADFLTKPIDFRLLWQKLQTHLRQSRMGLETAYWQSLALEKAADQTHQLQALAENHGLQSQLEPVIEEQTQLWLQLRGLSYDWLHHRPIEPQPAELNACLLEWLAAVLGYEKAAAYLATQPAIATQPIRIDVPFYHAFMTGALAEIAAYLQTLPDLLFDKAGQSLWIGTPLLHDRLQDVSDLFAQPTQLIYASSFARTIGLGHHLALAQHHRIRLAADGGEALLVIGFHPPTPALPIAH